jgi:hypothetical protein
MIDLSQQGTVPPLTSEREAQVTNLLLQRGRPPSYEPTTCILHAKIEYQRIFPRPNTTQLKDIMTVRKLPFIQSVRLANLLDGAN